MRRQTRHLTAAASMLLMLTFAAGPAAAREDQGWRHALRLQLAAEEDCQASFYTAEEVRDTDEGRFVSVRAHCFDGRAFDAIRAPGDPRFTLSRCAEVETC